VSRGGLLRTMCQLLVAAYPAAWRERYGAELSDVLYQHRPSLSTVIDLAFSAFDAHRHPDLAIDGAVPRTNRLRRGVAATVAASVAFAVAWVAVLSVRLRAEINHATPFQMEGDVGRAIAFVQVAGALSLLAALACVGLVVASTRSGRRERAAVVAVVLGTAAVFVVLFRVAGAGMENLVGGGQALFAAVIAWTIGVELLVRRIGPATHDSVLLRRAVAVGWAGVAGMIATAAGSVVLFAVVTLDAPSMDAELIPTVVLVIATGCAAVLLARAQQTSPTTAAGGVLP
jgi:hypothetical protein